MPNRREKLMTALRDALESAGELEREALHDAVLRYLEAYPRSVKGASPLLKELVDTIEDASW